ncbi:MAG: hypothetical protein Q4C13_07890, partial [Clostridia bacterium]|nr:hypothetical protein [Clostridia bacterium]
MEQTANTMDNRREPGIDCLKGFLCLLMLLVHAVYAFGYEQTGSLVWKALSHGGNLIIFPGFLFCFGFAAARAYLL